MFGTRFTLLKHALRAYDKNIMLWLYISSTMTGSARWSIVLRLNGIKCGLLLTITCYVMMPRYFNGEGFPHRLFIWL